jgi:hypothetical protein
MNPVKTVAGAYVKVLRYPFDKLLGSRDPRAEAADELREEAQETRAGGAGRGARGRGGRARRARRGQAPEGRSGLREGPPLAPGLTFVSTSCQALCTA